MSDHAMTAVEKVASIPPATVFLTSITGLVSWQDIFYIVSIIWVLIQIGFRLRKEWDNRARPPEQAP
jgi:hypothetical protein